MKPCSFSSDRIPRSVGLHVAAVALACACLLGAAQVSAQIIPPGRDCLWTTQGTSYIDFGGISGIPPLPADFFFPGSEPFTGRLDLGGETLPGYIEGVSTVVERLQPADLSSGSATVPVQLVELKLVTSEPITVLDGGGGGHLYNVTVATAPTPSLGSVTITRTGPDGGEFTFNSSSGGGIQLYVSCEFTPLEPGFPVVFFEAPPILLESATPFPWQFAEPPVFCFPGSGFYPVPGLDLGTVLDGGETGEHGTEPPREPQQFEACCMPDGSCIMAEVFNCLQFGGTPQGPGSQCSGFTIPCCLPDGTCLDTDPLCCDDLGGFPSPTGAQFCLGDGNQNGIDDACEEPQEPEACCFQDGMCAMLLPFDCMMQGGTPQGPGTQCSFFTTACCFPDGSCMDVDPICCDDLGGIPSPTGSPNCLGDGDLNGIDDACEEPQEPEACCLPDGVCVMATPSDCQMQGGIPQGLGSVCTGIFEACCLQDGSCVNLEPLCCDEIGGIPQGPGSACSANTEPCCLPDGSCLETDPLCCDDLGGTPSPIGAAGCMGDGNANGIDDACELPPQTIACCLPDGSCVDTDYMNCILMGGDPQGPGTLCINLPTPCVPLKWSQPPTLHPFTPYPDCFWGWDEVSNYQLGPIVADDWLCQDNRSVTDIHWWGSYNGWEFPEPPPFGDPSFPALFHIGIWTDVPAGVDQPWSHPGTMIWEHVVPREMLAERNVGCDFHPEFMTQPDTCFRYDLILPPDHWFLQDPDTSAIFWLSVSAIYQSPTVPQFPWGWKTRRPEWNDDAVRIFAPLTPGIGIFFIQGEPIETQEGSWDMAFVLTSEGGPEPEACCYADGSCAMLTPADCQNSGGVPQGPGSICTADEACCLPGGADNCIMADPLCCVAIGGVPQGAGTQCTEDEACCLSDGTCIMVDPLCCDELGGVPQGAGTQCTMEEACCFTDGTCRMLDPLCCEDLGGVPQGPNTVCTTPQSCCLPDGSCVDVDPLCCDELGGVPGFEPLCLGDLNGNNIDDACEPPEPLRPKWFQRPHNSGDGFDAASDLWLHQGFGTTPGAGLRAATYGGYVEAQASAHRPPNPAHTPPADTNGFTVSSGAPSRTWVPNPPASEANWDNDSYAVGGTLSWHTAISGQVQGQGKAKAGLANDGSIVVDARARVRDAIPADGGLTLGDTAWGYGKARMALQPILITGPGSAVDVTIQSQAYMAGPPATADAAMLGTVSGTVTLQVGVPFQIVWEDVAEARYPMLIPGRPGSFVHGSVLVDGAVVYEGTVTMTSDDQGNTQTVADGDFAGMAFAPWTAPGPQGQWYETDGARSHYGALFQTLVLPDGYEFQDVEEVNKVVADDFISDGRPIEAVRWWGSYFDERYGPFGGGTDPLHMLDGWLISFHHGRPEVGDDVCPPDFMAGDPPPTVLGLYFVPPEAVLIQPTGIVDCFGHQVFEYVVELRHCYLICYEVDPRTGTIPAQPRAFFEERGLYYWLDIQAVTGVTWIPVGDELFEMVFTGHLPSDLPGNDGHFWGWHTSLHCRMSEACTGVMIPDFAAPPPTCWNYGHWAKQPWLCVPHGDPPPPVNMAFELLTRAPGSACPHADVNMDGVTSGLDIAIITNSANFARHVRDAANPRADVNGDCVVSGLDVAFAASSACFGH